MLPLAPVSWQHIAMIRLCAVSTLIWAALIAGCSGMAREEVLMPQRHSGMANKAYPEFDLSDARLTILPTLISEELLAMFAPLVVVPTPASEINFIKKPLDVQFYVFVDSGEIMFDLDTFGVLVNDSAKHYPTKTEIQHIEHHNVGRAEYTWVPVSGTTTLPARDALYSFKLTFDIPRQETAQFSLVIGELTVNGRTIQLKPVFFERMFRTMPR